jgi:hypothetical protein
MAQHNFYFASATAAAAWIVCYGLASYSFGEAFADVASPAAVVLGLAAALIVLAVPALILRYEKRLLAKAELSGSGNQNAANDVAACRRRPNEIVAGVISSRVTPVDSAA